MRFLVNIIAVIILSAVVTKYQEEKSEMRVVRHQNIKLPRRSSYKMSTSINKYYEHVSRICIVPLL